MDEERMMPVGDWTAVLYSERPYFPRFATPKIRYFEAPLALTLITISLTPY